MAQTEDWSQFPEAPAEDWSQFPEADAAPAPKAAKPGLVDRGLAVMKNVGSALLDPMGQSQPSQSDRIVAGANEIAATQPGRARIEELGAPVRPEVARKVREMPAAQVTEPWQAGVQAAGKADAKRRRENAPQLPNLPADSLQQANTVPSLPSDEYQPSGTITGLQETLADGLARRAVESTGSDAMGSIVRDSVDLVGTLAKIAPTTGKMIFDTAQLAPVIGQIAEWGSDAMAEVISDISRGQSADIQAKASRLAQLARDGNGAQVAEYILAHPDLLADVAIPSAASMYVIGGVGRLTGNQVAASLPATVSARARERIRQRAAEQGAMWANIAANAGSAFAETDGPVGAKYLAALIAGAGTRSVAKITGGGAEGAIARGPGAVAANPVAQVAGIAGREAGQEFVEGASESIGSQTGEYVAGTRDDVSLRQAINQGTIEALAAGPTGGAAGVTVVAEAMQNDPHRIGLRAADAIARSIENGQWDQASIDAQVRASMDPNPGGVDGAAGLDAGRDSGRGAVGAGSGVVDAAGAGDAAQQSAGAPAVAAAGSEAGAPVAATGGESVPALTTGDPLQDAVLALEAEAFQGQAPEVAAAAQAAMPKPAAPVEPSAEQKSVADSLNSALPDEEKIDVGSVRILTPADLPDNEAGATPGSVVSRGTAELLTGIGEALGRRVTFYDYPGADGHADGFWSSRTADTVFLRPAVGSASVERVFGHEIQHSLEEAEKQTLLDAFMAATADGQTVVDMSDEAMLGFLSDYSGGRLVQKIEQLRGQGMPAAEVLDTLLKERGTTREALRDEFVSDIMGNRMAEPETWKKVFRNVAKQDTGVLRKIYRTLTDVINYLTNRGQSAQYREVEKHIRDLRAVRKAVAQVLASRMVKQQDAAPKAEGDVVLSTKRIGPFNSRVSAESSARYQPFDSNIVTGSDGKFYVEAINGTERAADPALRGESGRADVARGASRVQPDAVADRRDSGAAPARGERPSYGTARENAVRVVGVHYSKGDRTTLNGAYYGTGMKGAEAERLRGADPELLSRVYFYVDTGNGITPESDVGPRAHDVELTNLYDAFADPLGLNADAADTNAFELAVIRAGFDGYLIRQFGNQGAAVLVGRRHKAVPVRRTGDGPQVAEAAPAPNLSPERELAQRLTSNRRFPAGQLPPARWADVIFGLDPEAHDTLAEAGMFEGDTPVYLSELAGRYVRQAAQPRLSAPRADRNNTVSAVVGARPGEYNWSPAAKVSAALADRDTKVDKLEADVAPPPFAAPIQQSPSLERIGDAVRGILGSKGARTLIQDLTGVSGIKVTPIFGSWQGKGEPSFVLTGEGMTFEAAGEIGRLLGFAFAQDAVVATQPWFEETDDQIPFLRISQARAMSEDQARRLFEAARAEGLDYSTTVDGRGATFLHFGDGSVGEALGEKVARVAKAAGLSKLEQGFARSTLHEAETYLTGRVGEDVLQAGLYADSEGRPDLFRRTVDHLLVPYAKAVGAEGYRFSPDRFGERFGLTADQVEYIRAALRPKKGVALSTVGILTGAEPLEVAKRDFRKKKPGTLKEDLMWALQNRAAQIGFIDPSDRSPEARRAIAEAMADEVVYALGQEGGKSAIGWYDAALKRAKETYEQVFPELRSDADREMLFDAVLGITSQGNDVHSNAVFAGRVYHLVTREGMSISQAVDTLYGTFGKQTRAIELNLLKLEHLINTNGAAEVRRFFNQKSTVSALNAKLRNSPNLYDQNGAPLAADGQADQVVTGWMVFGPKIGSFINNLHGDYSTLTADLWFSRTWNRMTGFLFRYTPEKATNQYATAVRAAIAEAETGDGKDLAGWTVDEVRALVEDPDQFIPFLEKVHAAREADYKAGQALKLKDDALKAYAITTLRQAAKNLIETRGETVALPRNDTERLMQQLTVEEAQRLVKRKTGMTITVADIQAVLWYHEKNLFSKYGVGDKKAEAADYADAAARFVERFKSGDLFYVEKPEKRYVVGEKGSYLQAPDVRLSAPRIRVDGVERPTTNSTGRPIAATERGLRNFWRWFGDSRVVDLAGHPLVVYRGEHGESEAFGRTASSVPTTGIAPSREEIGLGQPFQSKVGSVTFSTREVAGVYATRPNDRRDAPVRPRVLPAYLRISNPLVAAPDDPFIDLARLQEVLGAQEALRIARKFAPLIENTDNWAELQDSTGFSTVDALLAADPSKISDLYFDIYALLDDPSEVSRLRQAGFDGAIHGGNGVSAFQPEYRVFSQDQVMAATGVRLSAPRLSAEERAVEQRFQDLIDQNPDRMVAAYLEDNGPVLDTDKARPLSPDYLENPSRWSAAVHEPASDLVKRIYARLLAEAPQGSTVLFTGGGGGSGKGYVLETLPELLDGAEVVYDMTMAGYGSTRSKIDQALAAGMRVRIAFVYRPPRLAMQGVLERGVATGRVVPIAPLADAHANAPRTLQRLQEEFAGDDRVTIEVVRNVGKTPRRAPLSGIAMRESADLLEEFTNEVERYFAEGRIDAVARDAYLGRSETDSGSGAGVSEGASGDERAGLRDDGRAGRAAPGGEAGEGVVQFSSRRYLESSEGRNDALVPDISPWIDDTSIRDLAYLPNGEPIRMRVGVGEESHRGYGMMHLIYNGKEDARRIPPKVADDMAEDFLRQIVETIRTRSATIHSERSGQKVVWFGSAQKALVLSRSGGVWTIVTWRPAPKNVWGNTEQTGRLTFPVSPAAAAGALEATPMGTSLATPIVGTRAVRVRSVPFDPNFPDRISQATVVKKRRRVLVRPDEVQLSTPRAPVTASFVAPDPTRWDGFIYKMQDRFIDLKRVQASIAEAGRQIQDQFDPYLAEELYHGRAAHRVQAFMQSELEPLLKKLKANQIEIEAFERYLHARHAKERNTAMKRANPTQPELDALVLQAEADLASLQQQRAGATGNTFVLDGLIRSAEAKLRALRMAKPWTGTAADREMLSGMSNADAAQILKSAPKVMAVLAKYVDKITAGTRDELRHYGLETDEVLDDMEKAYQFYVPLRRDMEESDLLGDMSMGTGQGFSVRGSKIKRATGSLRPVENILANIAAAREQAIVRGEKNRVTLALYGLALQHPNPEFWVAIRPSEVSNKAMRAELQGLGLPASVLQVMEDAPTEPHINERTGLVEHRVNPLLAQQPTVIALRVKGQDRLLVLSRDDDRAVRMAMALKNQDTQVDPASPLGAALRGLGITTRYLSSINTQYNPIFGLKNFIRDVQGAALTLTTTPIAGQEAALLAHVPAAMRAVWVSERGGTPNATWGALYQDFLAQGAQTGYRDMYAGMDDRARALQRVIEPAWWQKAKPLNAVLDALSDYNTAIENAVRLSAYKVALDAGLSKPRAASVAKNLTVNFNRKGQVGREASAMYAFFNASVQGTARIWETLKGPKGKAIIAGGIGLGVMQALIGYAIMGDDWDDIPEYVRSRNLIIPLGGDAGEDTGRAGSRYVMIPMPLGFNALPSIGRIFTEMAIFRDKLGSRALTAVTSVLDATNPLGSENPVEMALPSVLDPIYQLGANKNSFGQPIAREDMNSLDPTPGEVRFTRNATTFGKMVATGINRATGGDEWTPGLASPTPDQIDFVFGQVTGGVGRESMKVYQSLESLVTGDPVPASRVPVVGMFYGKTNSDQGIRAKYYAAVQDINLAERKLKGLAASGGDVTEHLAERPQAALYKTADKIGRKISELNRYRATLTAADRDKKKQIDQEVMALQSLLIDLHEQAKAEGQ